MAAQEAVAQAAVAVAVVLAVRLSAWAGLAMRPSESTMPP